MCVVTFINLTGGNVELPVDAGVPVFVPGVNTAVATNLFGGLAVGGYDRAVVQLVPGGSAALVEHLHYVGPMMYGVSHGAGLAFLLVSLTLVKTWGGRAMRGE